MFGFFKLGTVDWKLDADDMPTWDPAAWRERPISTRTVERVAQAIHAQQEADLLRNNRGGVTLEWHQLKEESKAERRRQALAAIRELVHVANRSR